MNAQAQADAAALVDLLKSDAGARRCFSFIVGEDASLDAWLACYGCSCDGDCSCGTKADARTFAAEQRDSLGAVSLRKPTRHPLCRCTSTPEFCNCAGAQYDPPDAERQAELIRQAARYGL